MTLFYLIRHGETDWNLAQRFQGQTDTPLNDAGRAQAATLIPRLRTATLEAIYSSDLSRTAETARIIFGDRPLRLDQRLREINVGRVAGVTYPELQTREPEFWAARQHDDGDLAFPGGGESMLDVQRRGIAALAALHEAHPAGAVVVVSHGAWINAVVCGVLGLPLAKRHAIVVDNCSLTAIRWEPSRMRLVTLNETGHLIGEVTAATAD